jgi:hypothetical protein
MNPAREEGMQLALVERDRGIQAAIDHAESVSPGWGDAAYEALVEFARGHECFTSEQFRAQSKVTAPTTPKAFGSIFRKAARNGVIVKHGYAIAEQRHLSPCPLWASLIFEEQKKAA